MCPLTMKGDLSVGALEMDSHSLGGNLARETYWTSLKFRLTMNFDLGALGGSVS